MRLQLRVQVEIEVANNKGYTDEEWAEYLNWMLVDDDATVSPSMLGVDIAAVTVNMVRVTSRKALV